MAPRRKNSDANYLSIITLNMNGLNFPIKVLPLSEKLKVLNLIRKEKIPHAEVAKVYGKNESSIHQIVKKGKNSC